ncbi:MAG TPA: aromatic ring-hydroxylating dioxygenase subunit alpha [Baekduia sp.]|nr:aromatic ring-hydroxylating dioxygenase subunit alpha [Baekduia sp.]
MASIIEQPRYFTSLPRDYYVSQEIYDVEMERVFQRQWLYAGHVSQIRETGDFFSRLIGPESLIITRDQEGAARAFFNVCRHRGAQLCETGTAGRTKRFVCPYHSWTYATDGRLLGAPGANDGVDFDFSDWSLHEALCDTFYGSIWVWLGDPDEAPSLRETLEARTNDVEMLRAIEPEKTKIAHQEIYDIKANWKLLMENNCECYHCAGAHPSLAATCDYAGFYTATYDENGEIAGVHFPLREGMNTFSLDGEWVCKKPLGVGFVPNYSCGYVNVPFFSGPVYFADHGVQLDLTPLDKDNTRLVSQWFVHEDAVEGVDYDIEKLIGVFHVTNLEDGELAALNARGVNSRRFVPGPNNATREAFVKAALEQYLALMDRP